jgi:hypothetical protein
MPKISTAPINVPFGGNIWIRFFTDIADALKGVWGYNKKKTLILANVTKPYEIIVYNQGYTTHLYIKWDDSVTFNNTTMSLDIKTDYRMLLTYIDLHDSTGYKGRVICEDHTIMPPNLTTSGETIITGTILARI